MKQNAAMSNRYRATDVVMIRDVFGFTYIEKSGPPRYKTTGIGPWQPGPFVVPSGVRVGQWGIENNCLMRSRGQGLSIFPPPVASPGFSMSMAWHERTHAHKAHQWARDQLLNVCIR